MADWELLRLYPGVLLQSAFGDFLRNRLDEKAEWLGAIEIAFVQCDKISKTDFAIQVEMSNQNDIQTLTPNDKETSLVISGKIKIQFCRLLGADWPDLATYLDIPAHRRNQFSQGRECHAILEWLEERDSLDILKKALSDLDRQNLVELLNTNNQ